MKNLRSYWNPMGFHSLEFGEYLSDDLSFPSDFVLYFSVACVCDKFHLCVVLLH